MLSGLVEPIFFAITGAIAAYKNGRPWLDELRQYLYDNKKFVADFIKR